MGYWELFLCFARIGLFTFGGGYAMISFIEDICVKKKKWITHDEMMEITVIAESTPGPVAINCATYVGYKRLGFLGATAATIGMILPSFFVIYVISVALENFLDNPLVVKAFQGIQAAVAILIIKAGISMIRKMKKKAIPVFIMTVSALAMLFINLFSVHFSSIALMLLAGALNWILFLILKKSEKKGEAQ